MSSSIYRSWETDAIFDRLVLSHIPYGSPPQMCRTDTVERICHCDDNSGIRNSHRMWCSYNRPNIPDDISLCLVGDVKNKNDESISVTHLSINFGMSIRNDSTLINEIFVHLSFSPIFNLQLLSIILNILLLTFIEISKRFSYILYIYISISKYIHKVWPIDANY